MTSLEERMVKSCSPTLAGIKSGNLFRYHCPGGASSEIRRWNSILGPKGIRLRLMRVDGDYSLIYVYRENMVKQDINTPEGPKISFRSWVRYTEFRFICGPSDEKNG